MGREERELMVGMGRQGNYGGERFLNCISSCFNKSNFNVQEVDAALSHEWSLGGGQK